MLRLECTYTARISGRFAGAQEVIDNSPRGRGPVLDLALLVGPHRHVDFLQHGRLRTAWKEKSKK